MKDAGFYTSLKRAIEILYMRVATSALHKRMRAHRRHAHHAHIHGGDISTPLLERLNQLSDSEQNYPETGNKMDFSLVEGPPRSKKPQKEFLNTNHHIVNRDNIRELSNYFEKQRHGSELHPPIAEKLEQSTWEHIHESIRCAKKGDTRNAKMHADVASHACKELLHYMNTDEHKAFIKEIEAYLDEL